MKKSRILALLAVAVLLLAALPVAGRAMSTAEREERYRATLLQLESYLQVAQSGNVGELEIIRANFQDLGRFSHSEGMSYYVTVLLKIEENAFHDHEYDFAMFAMENDTRFTAYLEELRSNDSAIGTLKELKTYAEAREAEYRGDTDLAFAGYQRCMGFFDATNRAEGLYRREKEAVAARATELMNQNNPAGAYWLWKSMDGYGDSSERMRYIEQMLGYVPENETDNPRAVTDCAVTDTQTDRISLRWTAMPHAGGYQVRYAPAGGETQTKKAAGNEVTLKDLLPGTDYVISVTAIYGQTEVSGTELRASTKLAVTEVPAPDWVTGLVLANTTADSLTYRWNASAGAERYLVSWKTHGTTTWGNEAETTECKYTLGGLQADTAYDFRVVAVNGVKRSKQVLLNNKKTASDVPPDVRELKVKKAIPDTVTLTRKKVSGADYRVFYRRSYTEEWLYAGVTDKGLFKVENLYSNASYDFRVVTEKNGHPSPGVVLEGVKTTVKNYRDGRLKTTSVSVDITCRQRSGSSGKAEAIRSFSAGTMADKLRNGARSYGIGYTVNIPMLKTVRTVKIRIDLVAPNGYEQTVYEEESHTYDNIGRKKKWTKEFLGDGFFDGLWKRYESIPTGKYEVNLYWDNLLMNSSTFSVS